MTLSDLIKMLEDLAQIAVTMMLVYVAYKIAALVDALNRKVKEDTTNPQKKGEVR